VKKRERARKQALKDTAKLQKAAEVAARRAEKAVLVGERRGAGRADNLAPENHDEPIRPHPHSPKGTAVVDSLVVTGQSPTGEPSGAENVPPPAPWRPRPWPVMRHIAEETVDRGPPRRSSRPRGVMPKRYGSDQQQH